MLRLKLQYLWPPDTKSWLIGKDPDAGKDWRQEEEGEGDDRGWDCWMASPTQWTWVQASSGCLWRTGKPGMLQSSMQRVGHNWAAEQQNCQWLNWPSGHMREVTAPEVPGSDKGMLVVNWMEPDCSTGKMEKSSRVESHHQGLLNASPWLVTKILSLSCEQVWLGSWLQGWASRQVQQELPGWGQESYIPRCYEV